MIFVPARSAGIFISLCHPHPRQRFVLELVRLLEAYKWNFWVLILRRRVVHDQTSVRSGVFHNKITEAFFRLQIKDIRQWRRSQATLVNQVKCVSLWIVI